MARRFILTADEIRAAEEAVIAAGTSGEELMERAGTAAAAASEAVVDFTNSRRVAID